MEVFRSVGGYRSDTDYDVDRTWDSSQECEGRLMKVYITMKGECSEGGFPTGTYLRREQAIERVRFDAHNVTIGARVTEHQNPSELGLEIYLEVDGIDWFGVKESTVEGW